MSRRSADASSALNPVEAGGLKLSLEDFRFLSAWIQGIDVHVAWDRYMSARGTGDLRRIRTTTRTLLDLLASVAKRHGDPTVAALLRREPTRIKFEPPGSALDVLNEGEGRASDGPAAAPKTAHVKALVSVKPAQLPTLDEFAETLSEPDFYSQAELTELWEERYGKLAATPLPEVPEQDAAQDTSGPTPRLRDTPAHRALKRRGRLIDRQLAALKRLETLAASAPEPDDLVEAWLDTETAKRLRAVGIFRLRELSYFVRVNGYRWYRKVPRIGEEGAGRLMRWLQLHEGSLGFVPLAALVPRTQLPVHVTAPKPVIGVVPIERLQVPIALSGERGSNRAPAERCKARARNDYEAITEWLELRRPTEDTGNAHTFRAYRKEAERFLLWSLFERRKALSDLDPPIASSTAASSPPLAQPGLARNRRSAGAISGGRLKGRWQRAPARVQKSS